MPALKRSLGVTLLSLQLLALISIPAAGCGSTTVTTSTSEALTATAATTKPAYVRQPESYYRGVIEPRTMELADMLPDTDRLADDNFNTVGILPPVLITQRAGGRPRVILEGEAQLAEGSIDDFHDKGMAVFVSPTTEIPELNNDITASDATLEQLREDSLRWAHKAQDKQVELFAPLCRYNQTLSAQAAGAWSANILPQIKNVFGGDVAAWVVPDPSGPPAPGGPHEFESLNYGGYDFLLVDIFPQDNEFDVVNYTIYVNDVIEGANEVAARDGLKGVMIVFGGWREQTSVDEIDGPALGAQGQAAAAEVVVKAAEAQSTSPGISGLFFQGWTLSGRGAKDFPVEQRLRELFGQQAGSPEQAQGATQETVTGS